MSSVTRTQKKVQDILAAEFGSVRVGADGRIRIPFESTIINIEVEEWINDQSIVVLNAVIATDSKSHPGIYEWINQTNSSLRFGSVYHLAGKSNITLLTYTMLGDYLDPAEMHNALKGVALLADKLDDEFVAKFGGKRYSDQ
jgi:hypothetical protein